MWDITNTSAYAFGAKTLLPFSVAIEQVKESFAGQGFLPVSEIDLREKLCDKLGVGILPYTVIGFCNPRFVLRALKEETEAGLLAPCNVLVRTEGLYTCVSVMNPYLLIRLTENNKLRELSDDIYFALERALEAFVKRPDEKLIAA